MYVSSLHGRLPELHASVRMNRCCRSEAQTAKFLLAVLPQEHQILQQQHLIGLLVSLAHEYSTSVGLSPFEWIVQRITTIHSGW